MTMRDPVADRVSARIGLRMTVVSRLHPEYNSLHEAYGILAEEVAEFFDEVRQPEGAERDERALEELIDIAVVAIRAAHTIQRKLDENG
jgi:NTP pyrophosphatase (non-canonical NTP hydrolase)